MEYCILRLVSKDGNFVDVRVPFESMITICRWFLNDHNDFEIHIVGRGVYDNVSCDRNEKFGICV